MNKLIINTGNNSDKSNQTSENSKTLPSITGGQSRNEQTFDNLDVDDYSSFVNKVMSSRGKENLNTERANNQSTFAKLGNASTKFLPNVILGTVSEIGYMLDLEDYANTDFEVGNAISDWAESLQKDVNKALPVHSNEKTLDLGNVDWWIKNGSNLAESATSFVAAGLLAGAITEGVGTGIAGFSKAGKVSQWLNTLGKSSQKAAAVTKYMSKAPKTLATALMLNQAEGAMSAAEVYKQTFEEFKHLGIEEAKMKASESASMVINFNRANILLNLTSANMFLKPSSLIKKFGVKDVLRSGVFEGAQEFGEEEINLLAEKTAYANNADKGFSFDDMTKTVLSKEGIEAGLLGFLGGFAQTGIVKGKDFLPLQKDENGERTSMVNLMNQRYEEQQEVLKSYDQILKDKKIGDFKTIFKTYGETLDAIDELKSKSNIQEDIDLINQSKDRFVFAQTYNAIKNETTPQLKELYASLASMTEEDARAKGYETNKNSPDYYVTRANKAIQDIESIENEYYNSFDYLNSNEVFVNKSKKVQLQSLSNDLISQETKKRYEVDKVISDFKNLNKFSELKTEEGIYPMMYADSLTPEQIKVLSQDADFKAVYDDYAKYKKRKNDVVKQLDDLDNTISEITSPQYQEAYKEIIVQKKREEKEKRRKAKAKNKSKDVKKKVDNVKKKVETEEVIKNKTEEEVAEVVEEPVNDVPNVEEQQTNPDVLNNITSNFEKFNSNNPLVNQLFSQIRGVFNAESTLKNKKIVLKNNADLLKKDFVPQLSGSDLEEITKLINHFDSLSSDIEDVEVIADKLAKDLDDSDFLLPKKQDDEYTRKGIRNMLNKADEEALGKNTNPLLETPKNEQREKILRLVGSVFDVLDKLEEKGIDKNNFEEVVKAMERFIGKDRFRKIFDKFVTVYNLATKRNVNPDYNAYNISDNEKGNIKGYKSEAKADPYVDNLKNNLPEEISDLETSLIENSFVPNTSYSSFTGEKVFDGDQILAYLSRDYKINYSISESGSVRAEKVDIDNEIKNLIDDTILSPNEYISGTKITLELDFSYSGKNSDGEIETYQTLLQKGKNEGDESKYLPIKIKKNGKDTGAFLHLEDWIREENVSNTEEIEEQKERLREVRQYILNNTKADTTILDKSFGKLIKTFDGNDVDSSIAFPNPDQEFGIAKDGVLYTGYDSKFEGRIINKLEQGKVYAINQIGNNGNPLYIAIPIRQKTLQTKSINSIIEAIDIFLSGEDTKKVGEEIGYDLTSVQDLKRFLNNFIYTWKDYYGGESLLKVARERYKDYNILLEVTGNGINFGKGGGLGVFNLSKNTPEKDRSWLRETLKQHLRQMKYNVSLTKLKNEVNIPTIENGKASSNVIKYDDYIKQITTSNVITKKLSNGEYVATIQPVIRYSQSFAIKNENVKENNIEKVVKNTIKDPLNNEIDLDNLDDSFSGDDFFLPTNNDNPYSYSLARFVNSGINISLLFDTVESLTGTIINEMNVNEKMDISQALDRYKSFLNTTYKTRLQASENNNKEFLLNQLEKLTTNWDDVKRLIYNNLQQIDEVSLNYVEEIEENQEEDKLFYEDKSSLKVNPITQLSKKVKFFLKGVEKVTPKGVKRTAFGFPVYMDYVEVHNDLIRLFNESNNNRQPTIDSFTNKLKSEFQNNPTKKYLGKIIEKFNDSDIQTKIQIVNHFYSHDISLKSVDIRITRDYFKTSKGTETIDNIKGHIRKSNSNSIYKIFLNEWNNKVVFSDLTTQVNENEIYFSKDSSKFTRIENIISSINEQNSIDSFVSILQTLDIFIPRKALEQTLSNMFYGEGELAYQLYKYTNSPLNSFIARFNTAKREDANLKDFNLFDDSSFRTFAVKLSTYSSLYTPISYLNGVGNSISSFGQTKFTAERLMDIKGRNKEVLKALFSSPFSKNSTWLNQLASFNEITGEVQMKDNYLGGHIFNKFNIEYVDSLVDLERKYNTSEFENLKNAQYDLFQLLAFQNSGIDVKEGIPSKADSTKTTRLRMAEFLSVNHSNKKTLNIIKAPVVNVNLNKDGSITNYVVDKIYNSLVMPEIYRMIDFQQTDGHPMDEVKGYSQGANYFYFIPEVNNINGIFLEDGILNPEVITNKDLQESIKNVVRNHVTTLIENKKKSIESSMDSLGSNVNIIQDRYKTYVSSWLNGNSDINYLISDFVVNDLIAKANYYQLFVNDPAQYFKPTKETKNIDISELTYEDKLKNIESTFDNIQKRSTSLVSPYTRQAEDVSKNFTQIVVKDAKINSLVTEYRNKLYKNNAYDEIEATDAQELVTEEEHINDLYYNGELSLEQYQSLTSKLNNDIPLSKTDVDIILQPRKPRFVDDIPVYDKEGNLRGLRRVYIKSSSFPLIRSMVKGTELSNVYKWMKDIKADRLVYSTGIKVGGFENATQIWDNKGKFVTKGDITKLTLPRKGYGEQQKVPLKDENLISDGTQSRKLLPSYMIGNKFNVNSTLVSRLNIPSEYIKDGKIDGKDLSKVYVEQYNNLYSKQLNQYLKELTNDFGNIDINKVASKLQTEADKRGDSLVEKDYLTLVESENGVEFEIPLFFSLNKKRISSLINSMPNNLVRKVKFPGKSFVLGSEVGMTAKELKNGDIEKFGIITTDSFDSRKGLYPGDSKRPAQVIIPFTFKDNLGNSLDIKNFLTDGNKLDLTKIPQELLKIVGFRIPTASLGYISSVEIVGFLPKNQGDLMFAPKDFIVHMGSDFDIDKLYSRMYSYYVTKDNELKIYRKEDFSNINVDTKLEENYRDIVQDRQLRKDLALLIKTNQNEVDILKEMLGEEEAIEFLAKDSSRILPKLKELREEKKQYSNELNALINDTKILEQVKLGKVFDFNNIVDISFLVLDSGIKSIETEKYKPSDYGLLYRDNEYDLSDLMKEIKGKTFISGIDSEYQKSRYISAQETNSAIGAFANLNTFIATAKTIDKKLDIGLYIKKEDGSINFNKLEVTIGELKSNSLNTSKGVEGNEKQDTSSVFLSTAVDNENLRALDLMNVNKETYSIVGTLVSLGFREDTIIYLLNQEGTYKALAADVSFPKKERLSVKFPSKQILLSLLRNKENPHYDDYQRDIFENMSKLKQYANSLNTVISGIGIESKGTGKDMNEYIEKRKQVYKLLASTQLTNDDSAFLGEVRFDSENSGKIDSSEYYYVGYGMYVKPTTIQGSAIIPTLQAGNLLLNALYPNANQGFTNALKQITDLSIRSSEVPAFQSQFVNDVESHIKSYILSSREFGLFDGDIETERKRLFFDEWSKGKQISKSLGTLIQEIKKTDLGKTNVFLRTLEIVPNKSFAPTTIKLPSMIDSESSFNNALVYSLIDLVQSNKDTGIKDAEGNSLMTNTLVTDLLRYEILRGGEQKAVEFLKVIPPMYLKQLGITEKLRNYNWNKLTESNTLLNSVTIQYFQHNPFEVPNIRKSEMRDFPFKNVEFVNNVKELSHLASFEIDWTSETTPKVDSPIMAIRDGKDVHLYLENLNGRYTRIDNLGHSFYREYDSSSDIGSSLVQENKRIKSKLSITPPTPKLPVKDKYEEKVDNTKSKKDYLGQYDFEESASISSNINNVITNIALKSENPFFREYAKFLSKKADLFTNLSLFKNDTELNARGRYRKSDKSLRLNLNNISSKEEFELTFLHEATHAITVDLISKYKSNDKSLSKDLKSQLRSLEGVYNKYVSHVGEKGIKSLKDKIDKIKSGFNLSITSADEATYGALSFEEFVAMAMSSEEMQKELDKIKSEYNPTKNKTWSLKDAVLDILNSVLEALGFKRNGSTKAVIQGIFNLIGSTKITDLDSQSNLDFDFLLPVLHNPFQRAEFIQKELSLRNKFVAGILAKARKNNDISREQYFSDISDKLQEEYQELGDSIWLDELETFARNDLNLLDRIFNQDTIQASEVKLASRIIDLWESYAREDGGLLIEDERKSDEVISRFAPIATKITRYRTQLLETTTKLIEGFVYNSFGEKVNIKNELENTKDSNWFVANTLNLSRTNNVLLQALGKELKNSGKLALQELNEIDENIDELYLKIKDKISPDFSEFKEVNKDGFETGNLISPFSYEFYKEKQNQLNSYLSSSNGDNYFKWLKKNTIVFDFRKLFPNESIYKHQTFDKGLRDKYKAELKEQLGEKLFKEFYDKSKKGYKQFIEDRKSYVDSVESNKKFSDKEKVQLIEEWDLKNSPYWFAKSAIDGVGLTLNNKNIRNFGYKYTETVPKRFENITNSKTNQTRQQDLGWYNNDFGKILEDEDVLKFYNYISDKFKDLLRYIPGHKKRNLVTNFIPTISLDLMETFTEKGFKESLLKLKDGVIESSTISSLENSKFVDEITDKEIRDIPISGVSLNDYRVIELIQKYLLEARAAGKEITKEVQTEIENQALQEVARNKSFDLPRILKLYAKAVLTYKHKSAIEDIVNLSQTLIENTAETEFSPDGSKVRDQDNKVVKKEISKSFENTKDSLNYFVNALYGKSQESEGVLKKKILTTQESRDKADFERIIKEAEDNFSNDVINEEEKNAIIEEATSNIENLGKEIKLSGVGNNLLKWVQLKGMGWNLFSYFMNKGIGFIQNLIEGAGAEYFSASDYLTEYFSLIKDRMSFAMSGYQYETDELKKTKALAKKFDLMKDGSQELFKRTTERHSNGLLNKFKKLDPYFLTQDAEFVNQAPLMKVFLKKETLQDKNGNERSLWDAYTIDGKWNEDEFDLASSYNFDNKTDSSSIVNLVLKVEQLIARKHGDYNPDSTQAVKKKFIGRALVQFRMWMMETTHERYENEKMDRVLGKKVKGRYISYVDFFKGEGVLGGLATIGTELIKGLVVKRSFSTMFNEVDSISDTDKANMRRNMAELLLYGSIVAMGIMLKMSADDEEDETKKILGNYLMNQFLRLQTDITFYSSPNSFDSLLRDPIPAMRLMKDVTEWSNASYKFILGDDIIERGVHSGQSRLFRESLEITPFFNQIYRQYNSGIQVFDK